MGFMDDYIKIVRDRDVYRYIDRFCREVKEYSFDTLDDLESFLVANACQQCNPPVIQTSHLQITDRTTGEVHVFTADFYTGVKLEEVLGMLEAMFRRYECQRELDKH